MIIDAAIIGSELDAFIASIRLRELGYSSNIISNGNIISFSPKVIFSAFGETLPTTYKRNHNYIKNVAGDVKKNSLMSWRT